MNNNQTIQVNNLTASYGKNLILQDLSFSIQKGDFICLCGPNGSGKSTLLSCLANVQSTALNVSQATKILLNTKLISDYSPTERAKKIAYLQQTEVCTWNFSVFDFVLQGRFCHTKNGFYTENDKKIVQQNLEILEIENLSEKLIHNISGGEFQKVRLARAISQEPDFLLLDEPAANLDFIYEPKMMELLIKLCSKKNIGIILSIHNLNIAARYAQKVILLSKAQNDNQLIFTGNIKDVFTQENLSKAFNQELKIYNHPIYNTIQIC